MVEEKVRTRRLTQPPGPGNEPKPSGGRAGRLSAEGAPVVQSGIDFITAGEIEPERVTWLWDGWLPKAKLVDIDGSPGLGKSTITIDLVARLSTGASMPDGTPGPGTPTTCCLIGGEDGLADTVRPRLEAAHADLDRVLIPRFRDDVGARPFVIGDDSVDVAHLAALVDREQVSLLVIDPLMAHLGAEVNSYRDQDIRRALARLQILTDLGCTVLFTRHHTKGATSAVYGGGGSIGITGACRVVWTAGRRQDGSCVLAQAKNNLAPLQPSMGYQVASDDDLGCGRIDWLGPVEVSADELVVSEREERSGSDARSTLEDAEDYIREALMDGPIPSRELIDGASENGISERTLKRARKSLGVQRTKGFSGWRVYLPDQQGHGPPMSETGTLGTVANSAPEPGNGVISLRVPRMPADIEGGGTDGGAA